jgi:hypothetical protein
VTGAEVTPATMRALAGQAAELAEAVATAAATMRAAADAPTRLATFRLDDLIGELRRAGYGLEDTAKDLARIRGRSECPADWGVCPDHGATLASLGGRSACTVRGCARAWDYDRAGLPCSEPVAFEVHHDGEAGVMRMCAGHARDAEARLIGATRLVPIQGTR